MKVKTVNQFKVLEFIEKNFNLDMIRLELVDDDSIRVIDSKNESMLFNYYTLLRDNCTDGI